MTVLDNLDSEYPKKDTQMDIKRIEYDKLKKFIRLSDQEFEDKQIREERQDSRNKTMFFSALLAVCLIVGICCMPGGPIVGSEAIGKAFMAIGASFAGVAGAANAYKTFSQNKHVRKSFGAQSSKDKVKEVRDHIIDKHVKKVKQNQSSEETTSSEENNPEISELKRSNRKLESLLEEQVMQIDDLLVYISNFRQHLRKGNSVDRVSGITPAQVRISEDRHEMSSTNDSAEANQSVAGIGGAHTHASVALDPVHETSFSQRSDAANKSRGRDLKACKDSLERCASAMVQGAEGETRRRFRFPTRPYFGNLSAGHQRLF